MIQFFWIPSHVGIEGNERADNSAKQATAKAMTNVLKDPFTDVFERFNKMTSYSTKDMILN